MSQSRNLTLHTKLVLNIHHTSTEFEDKKLIVNKDMINYIKYTF